MSDQINFRNTSIEDRKQTINKLRGRPPRTIPRTAEEKSEAARLASLKYYYTHKEVISARLKNKRQAKKNETITVQSNYLDAAAISSN